MGKKLIGKTIFSSARRTFAAYGIAFGLLFPIASTVLDIWLKDLSFSWSHVLLVQEQQPLHWIIDLAPLVLGWIASIIGTKQDKLQKLNENLSGRVELQTKDLREQNLRLRSEIEERQRIESELKQAKEAAEAAAIAKAEFLSTMSHEIRTPMNAVIGMSGLLIGTELNEEQKEYAETIRISGDNLLSVINDILDFSKIESGKMEVEYQEMVLLDPIEDTLDLLATKAEEKQIELLCDIQEGVPEYIISDLAKIRQVIVNLVNNAIKFTAKGEILVSIQAKKINNKQFEILYSVKDTGIGIPEDRLNRLFKSFSQVDASTTRKYGGTGLGLAISKKIVELLGGNIWVESVEGVGSTFSFSILAEPTSNPSSFPNINYLHGKRVLIVDDNATNIKILEKQCQSWGLSYESYDDPLEVKHQLAAGNSWDLGILDMQMPKLDGIELAMEIRKIFSSRQLPLILLSSIGYVLTGDQKHMFQTILSKPTRQRTLLRQICRLYQQDSGFQDRRPSQLTEQDIQQLPDLKILLAEDNAVNQKVASRILQKLGYQIDIAANGEEAVKAVEMINYDLVFMDMQMPVMDGLEATEKIRENISDRSLIIIAMTANASPVDRQRCLDAGMNDYLAKPIQMPQIFDMIKKWFVEDRRINIQSVS